MKRLQPPAPLTRRVSGCKMKCGSCRVARIALPPSSISFQYVLSSDAVAGCASAMPPTSAIATAARTDCSATWTNDILDLGRMLVYKAWSMDLPRTASAVVIGGGVVGCSIAYNLARRGLSGVVVVERETVGSGTTSKAAGGIRVQFPTETEIRFSLEAIRVFEGFEDEFGVDPGYRKIGYLFLVATADDLRGFEQRVALQQRLGVDVRIIAPDDAQRLVPALRVDDLVAAVWGPGDGMAGPAEVTSGFARRARELGARIVEGVAVVGIDLDGGRVRGLRTDQGAITAP